MDKKLKDRVAVVTGGSAGISFGAAEHLATEQVVHVMVPLFLASLHSDRGFGPCEPAPRCRPQPMFSPRVRPSAGTAVVQLLWRFHTVSFALHTGYQHRKL